MAEPARADEFVRLYSTHERRLRAYVLCLLPRWSDAEEVSQQVSLILWKKFDRFRAGSNFFAWACEVARREVKDFRKRQARERLVFSDELLDALSREMQSLQAELPVRLRALQDCVSKLAKSHRELLRLRYEEGGSVEHVARTVNRSVDSVYKLLSRIRLALHECINRSIAMGKI
jgi:RNA polymerase sigma-70 factor, ECF subfamily